MQSWMNRSRQNSLWTTTASELLETISSGIGDATPCIVVKIGVVPDLCLSLLNLTANRRAN